MDNILPGMPVVVDKSGEVGVVVDFENERVVVEFSASDAGMFWPEELRVYNGYGGTLFTMQ